MSAAEHTFGKDKTASGTGRTIPLSGRAATTLEQWAAKFPDRAPTHFVFPQEKYGGTGSTEAFGFVAKTTYDIDPSKPIGDPKVAWEYAKRRAGRILYGDGSNQEGVPAIICRFHDLRHTAVSRMLNAGVSMAKVAKIVGWSPSTMVQMSARYGHFTLEEMRDAVENISR